MYSNKKGDISHKRKDIFQKCKSKVSYIFIIHLISACLCTFDIYRIANQLVIQKQQIYVILYKMYKILKYFKRRHLGKGMLGRLYYWVPMKKRAETWYKYPGNSFASWMCSTFKQQKHTSNRHTYIHTNRQTYRVGKQDGHLIHESNSKLFWTNKNANYW